MAASTNDRQISVTLLTRKGCHLCDEAKEVLLRHGLSPVEIDIDSQPELQMKFGECVPVVRINGVERFRGRINEVLLRRLLNKKMPRT